jgi:tetratricopeptide (TPR) repeat protein
VAARVEKARATLLRDDAASLEQAAALFTEAARLAPGAAMPEAERAFALLLQAAADKDLADRLEAAGKDAAGEREAHARDATRLLQQALAAAKAALDDDPDNPAALRAMALHAALTGGSDHGMLRRAEVLAPRDPWIKYTRAAAALAGPASRERQDRALALLSQARQAEPRMLRVQVDAAGISVDRQEAGPARELLGRVLQENSRHERARRLLSLLPAAPR